MKAFLVVLFLLSLPAAFFAFALDGLQAAGLVLIGGIVAFSAAAICDSVDDLRKQQERWRLQDKPPAPVPISERPPIKI